MKKSKMLSAILSLSIGVTSLSYISTYANAFDIPVMEGSFSVKSGDIEVVPGGSVDVVLWVSQVGSMTFTSDDPDITVEPDFMKEPQLKNNNYNTITVRCAEGAAIGKAEITVRYTNYLSGAAKEDKIEVNIVGQKSITAIGAVSLELSSDSNYEKIKGENIIADGKYDVTWDVSDHAKAVGESDLKLVLDNYEPFELGERDKIKLNIEEIWLDGVKYEGDIARAPIYRWATDGYRGGKVLYSDALLKNAENTGFAAENSVRVVFTLSGLLSPELESGAICGDVNSDKKIDSVDASLVLSHYALVSTDKEDELSDEQLEAADVDKNGVVNANDASKILTYYSNIST